MDKAAIIGVGQTSFEAEKRDKTYADLAFEAAEAALKDAKLAIDRIDNIVTVSNDFLDGRTISSMPIGDAVGAAFGKGKSISTVEGDGLIGAIYGLSRTLSGRYGTTLVVAHGKASEGDHHLITNAYFDPIFERPLGLDWISAAAIQARACSERWKWTDRQLAEVAARHRASGARNPKAHLRQEISADEVLASDLLAPPIRREEVAPLSDGAAAVVLANEKGLAENAGSGSPVNVLGVGFCADAGMSERDLSEAPALRTAAARAYEMAGIKDPKRQISLVEHSGLFTYQEPLFLKEMGLEGIDPKRVNPSGGCLCAYAPVAAGLARLVEGVQRLRASAGGRALINGHHGLAAQSQAVWIIGN